MSATSPVPYALPIDAGVVPDSDAVYQALLAKTDFESTPTAATIHKFLDPLKAIPDTVMPSNVKFKTAVIQATAQAGLTQDGILATFDTLTAKLQQESDAFAGKSQQFAAREVAGRQDQIQKITEQITELQQQLAQLSNELVDAQGKASHAQSQFEAAVQRRGSELEQQKALYASLLKG
jgi:ABC-type transporter Mla subunit MlaD